jgi:hypothetical protein
VDLNPQQIRLLRMIVGNKLTQTKKIPSLAREQAIISLTSNFEAYISDLLREIFDKDINYFKSNNCNLRCAELIESLKNGNTIEILKEAKIRDLMRTVDNCIDFYHRNLGFQISFSSELKELYLVRNCIVHNGGIINKKLEEFGTERYKLGAKIDVTEEDYARYKSAIIVITLKINTSQAV